MQQPPSGGCVLKLIVWHLLSSFKMQPPSGGCVLKPVDALITNFHLPAAAFGRLCVETTRLIRMVGNANRSRLRAVVC